MPKESLALCHPERRPLGGWLRPRKTETCVLSANADAYAMARITDFQKTASTIFLTKIRRYKRDNITPRAKRERICKSQEDIYSSEIMRMRTQAYVSSLIVLACLSMSLCIANPVFAQSETSNSAALTLEQLKARIDAGVRLGNGGRIFAAPDMQRLIDEALLRNNGKPIYGVDNRLDWYEIYDPKIKGLARASFAIVPAQDILDDNRGNLKISSKPLKSAYELCPEERFANQMTGAICSGVLVRPDLVVTAGHCVREVKNRSDALPLKDIRFVFGYWTLNPEDPGQMQLENSHVFRGKEIVNGKFLPEQQGNDDWALIRLDRAVPKEIAEPVSQLRSTKVPDGARVYVIGYPSGLPLKYAPGARVRSNSERAYFVANLDTFGGNSGSGVFMSDSNELVGILVRGDIDYYLDDKKGCTRPFVCPSTGCNGEHVTRIEIVGTAQK